MQVYILLSKVPQDKFHNIVKLGGHRHGNMMFLVCHVIWEDHVIKVLRETLWVGASHGKSPTCQI